MKIEPVSTMDTLTKNVRKRAAIRQPSKYKEIVRNKLKKVMHKNLSKVKGNKIDIEA